MKQYLNEVIITQIRSFGSYQRAWEPLNNFLLMNRAGYSIHPRLFDGIQQNPSERIDEVKKLNNYFFDSEEIHPSDALWFYGTLGGASLLTLVLWVVTL